MEKLTLKEIAGYLPYDLQILCNSEEEEIYISTMVGLHLNGIDDNFGNNWDLEVKPLLYPLEMLTKTIVHNGVEIIPLVKHVESFGEPCDDFDEDDLTDFQSAVLAMLSNYEMRHQSDLEFLQEHHFDYQNLIGRGLAVSKEIDKSTLNSK